jgi:hypothetical protein
MTVHGRTGSSSIAQMSSITVSRTARLIRRLIKHFMITEKYGWLTSLDLSILSSTLSRLGIRETCSQRSGIPATPLLRAYNIITYQKSSSSLMIRTYPDLVCREKHMSNPSMYIHTSDPLDSTNADCSAGPTQISCKDSLRYCSRRL